MDNQIILSNLAEINAPNITFTPSEWMQLSAYTNGMVFWALVAGMLIGAIVGIIGYYIGTMWYNGHKR